MHHKEEPYLYQTIHVLGRRPLYLERHTALLDAASRELFERSFAPDLKALNTQIEALLDTNRHPATSSSFVRIELTAEGDLRLLPGTVSLYNGYALRSLRPAAIVLSYDLPLSDYPTSARDAALQLALQQARKQGVHSVIRCDREGLIHTGDDAPLFAVKGEWIYTCPAPPSVERELALHAIEAARLSLVEQEIGREQLPLFDELFYFDHRGITSLSSCESVLYTEIIASRIAQKINMLL